jgi:hypothetical protein
MRLHKLPIYKDSVLLRAEAGEKELSLFLNHNVMPFLLADGKFIALREAQRDHSKVLHRGLSINQNLQMAHELVKRKIDPMLFVDSDVETKLHQQRSSDPRNPALIMFTLSRFLQVTRTNHNSH